MTDYRYPPSLPQSLRSLWTVRTWPKEKVPALPRREILERLLNVAYHATFTIEEGRRTKFRLAFGHPAELARPAIHRLLPPYAVIELAEPRPYSVAEITRFAPATDPTRVLLGVDLSDSGDLQIWGLLDVGSSWWEFTHHETSGGMPPPNVLTLASNEPGNLEISRSGRTLLSLRRGTVHSPLQGVFYSGPIAAFLEPARNTLYQQVCASLGTKEWDPKGVDDDYPRQAYTFLLEHLLHRISVLGHGGAVIVVRDDLTSRDTRLTERLLVKYRADDGRLWALLARSLVLERQFYDLHFPLWASEKIDGDDFHRHNVLETEREEVEISQRRCCSLCGRAFGCRRLDRYDRSPSSHRFRRRSDSSLACSHDSETVLRIRRLRRRCSLDRLLRHPPSRRVSVRLQLRGCSRVRHVAGRRLQGREARWC